MIHDKRRFSVTLLALALAFAPHLPRVPVFVGVFVFLAWGYALGMQYRGWPVPPRWLRAILALACLALVLSTYGRSFGRDAGVALLSLMLGLKAVESKSVRDMLALLFLAYFVVVTNVLYSQTLVMSAYMFFSVMAVTAALVHLHSGEPRLLPDLRRGGLLLGQALPLALILFVFFPRLQGALWGVHDERDEGVSGFSDTLEPGSVAALSLSREVAFRVDFPGAIPGRDSLYWRGLVLDSFDGVTWFRDLPFDLVPPRTDALPAQSVFYTLTMEPHNREWVFALDLPVLAPRGTVLRSDQTLASLRMVRSRVRYELAAVQAPRLSPVPGPAWTALPESGNPKARALAGEWKNAGLSPGEMVAAALTLFREGGFVYSLRPGAADEDIVDQFLFATRLGYCEHYSSAMAFLLRAAGVPVRVVVGYQGGEENPMGGYLIVRQSDAHAWVEVWMDGRWLRVDPTSVVAPQRLVTGVESFVPQGQGGVLPEGVQALRKVGRFFQWGWDAANNSWNQWVLGFSHERQRNLWERLGIDPATRAGAGKLAGVLAVGLCIILGGVFGFMLRSRRGERDQVVFLYGRFCRKLAKLGLVRGLAEGPRDFARRIGRQRPELDPAVRSIVDAYVDLRYSGRGDLAAFKRLIDEFMGRKI
jgi:transglutaminase-like putative cysteine protease